MRHFVSSPWIGIGLIAVTLAMGAEPMAERMSELVAKQAEKDVVRTEKEEYLAQVDLDADLAMARISGNCTILFNTVRNIPANKITDDYSLVNVDGVQLRINDPICAADGETALVGMVNGVLRPVDIRKVPINRLPEYQEIYSVYREVREYERISGQHSKQSE